jgi:hypothetical protein
VLPDQIDDAPAIVPLLDVLIVRFVSSERRNPEPSNVANMVRSRSPFFPVTHAHAVRTDALDPANSRGRRRRTLLSGRLDR